MVAKSKNPADAASAYPVYRCSGRILIIEARFYEDIGNDLMAGAIAEIEAAGATFTRIAVPGALEIPQVLAQAAAAGQFSGDRPVFSGAVALGCVIRGETGHYDIVCNNANHWLMDVSIRQNIPLGNAILTVETMAQAEERARGGRDGKGGDAARACLRMIEVSESLRSGGGHVSASRSTAG
jgi:6,7-dimethyl-8-ribityllumazine synthase